MAALFGAALMVATVFANDDLSPRERFARLFGECDTDAAEARMPLTDATAATSVPLWLTYCEYYAGRCRSRFPGLYAEQVQRVLIRFTSLRGLADKRLDQLTSRDLELYLQERQVATWRGRLLSPRTINNEVAILNTALAHAGPRGPGVARANLGYLAHPPYCEFLQELDLAPIAITPEQFAALLSATQHARLPEIDGCSPRAFWATALLLDRITLLRRGSLLRIPRPSDAVLRERRQLVLPAAINKTRRTETISLGSRDDVIELLISLPSREGEPLLPWRDRCGTPLSLATFSRHLREMQMTAGIESGRVRLKDLRSTGATEVIETCGEEAARRKTKHSANTGTLRAHYVARRVTADEVRATDLLVDRFLAAASLRIHTAEGSAGESAVG
jgi:hypothetical protein